MNSFFYLRSVLDGQEVAKFLSAGSEYLCGEIDTSLYAQEVFTHVLELWNVCEQLLCSSAKCDLFPRIRLCQ